MNRAERRRQEREARKAQMTNSTTCPNPQFFNSNRCCMCGGNVRECPCTPQDAIDHFVMSHVTDYCDVRGSSNGSPNGDDGNAHP